MVTDDTFSEGVRDRHLRIDPAQWDEIAVIGDVHGCREALERLVDRLPTEGETLLVFVGDLIRKGPDSPGVVSFVREHGDAISVRGNNEAKVIRGEKTVPGLGWSELAYLESLPVVISWEDSIVVHGGVDPRRSIGDLDFDSLVTTRSLTEDNGYHRPYWFEEYDGSARVFFGHTVLERPFATDSVVGLDTGCVYGGSLTAYLVGESRFVSVDPERTHEPRSDDSFVRPRVRERA